MKKKIDYDNWSKDELIKEIKRIKETTYGLVWHRDLPEEKIDVLINPDARTPSEMFPNEMAGKPFPVLKEVKTKAIETDKNKPTNILIEGDNYHSLAVLNFTHQEAIDLIYIDPPYNTGNKDFIYNDSFVDFEDPYRHSKWLSFMEKRLKLAKNVLKKTGVILISIDDNEQAPLKMLCDEIFGQENFIEQIIWKKRATPPNDRIIGRNHEYILCYGKTEFYELNLLPRTENTLNRYSNPDNDKNGPWAAADLSANGKGGRLVKSCIFAIKNPINGLDYWPPKDKCWLYNQEKVNNFLKEGRISFRKSGTPFLKRYLNEVRQGQTAPTIWPDAGFSQDSAEEIKNLFEGENIFENPKPTTLIKRLLTIGTKNKNAIILDFFAGSGTTAHAILELNKEDGGNRKFILCTNNEDEKSVHRIATDICFPRIEKVIKGYKNLKKEKVDGLGGNLRYFTAYDFVEAKETDRNKRKLVNQSTEMLCIKESAFDLVQEAEDFKIFRNHDKYLGIIFHEDSISDYAKAIKKIKGHFNTYTFSMTDDPHKEEFSEVEEKVTLCAIPEVILKVYREIFKE